MRALLWSALNDAMPLYAAYTLLFADSGLGTSRISLLLVIWSATAVVLEVPSGALADRFSPRAALMAAGILRAVGYTLWIVAPGFLGFAAGFVLWGAAGSLESGSFQSLLYSGLERHGAGDRYVRVLGRTEALARVAEVGATLAAAPLLVLGGTDLVGWVSVGVSLIGSAVAAGFSGTDVEQPSDCAPLEQVGQTGPGYLELLASGIREAWGRRPVRRLVMLLAVVYGLTAVDEYVPLLARAASVPRAWIPVVLATLPLAAAAGNALAGTASRARPAAVAVPLVVVTGVLFAAAAVGSRALLPVLGCWWLLINLATVLTDARLQDAVSGPARATVTSVAALGSELAAIAMFLAVAALS